MRSRSTSLELPSGLASPLRVTIRGPDRPTFSWRVGLTVERYKYMRDDCSSLGPGAADSGTSHVYTTTRVGCRRQGKV